MDIVSILVVSITTFVVFIAMTFSYGMSRLDEIKSNWVQYRCNPIYMPLAGMVGSDVASNFMNCTLQSVNTYAGFVMDPIYKNFKILTSTIQYILNSMNALRAAVNGASQGFLGIVKSIFGKLQNTFQTVIQLIARSRTIMNRMMASFAVLMNIVSTGVQTGQSVANGPIGKAGAFLEHCFHPETIVHLANNVRVRIADIEAGDVLANGKVVKSVLEFDGMSTPMYSLKDVVVSGSHKVLHEGCWIRVEHHPDAVEHNVCPRIHCLNVEGRQLYIGGFTFKDYEETDNPDILAEFFGKVQRSYGAYNSPWKYVNPLRYRFTGVSPSAQILMEDGTKKSAWDVEIGDRLLYGGSVIGRAIHTSVEMTSVRECGLALGTWIQHPETGEIYAAMERTEAPCPRNQVVQFLTETSKYAAMAGRNEITVLDMRETTDADIWKWRDVEVQKERNW